MSDGLSDILDRFLRLPFPEVRHRAVPAMAEVAARLASIEEKIERPKPDELIVICRRIDAALAAGEPLSRRDLRLAPWCLWAPDMPLAEIPGRLQMLLDYVAVAGRAKLFKTLAMAWGHAFALDRAGIAPVGQFLASRPHLLGEKWAAALRLWPLFDPQRGPRALAETAIAVGKSPEIVLEEAGVGDFAKCLGYVFSSYALGLGLLEHGAQRDPERRLVTLHSWIFDKDHKLRHGSLAAPAVRAAIEPFAEAMPEKGIRDRYIAFALSLLGDPRSQSHRWTNCRKSQDIMRRWLTEQTLRQFFDVVDRVAPEGHWKYRRAFWNALYARNLIDEAWVVFEYHGQNEARRMFGKDLEFGTISGSGIQAGHSVLLLRIGTLTVAEWSHNSPCSIWDENANEGGPHLYGKHYEANNLKKKFIGSTSGNNMEKQGVFYHWGSENLTWQRRVARFLKTRRGISIPEHEYRV